MLAFTNITYFSQENLVVAVDESEHGVSSLLRTPIHRADALGLPAWITVEVNASEQCSNNADTHREVVLSVSDTIDADERAITQANERPARRAILRPCRV